MASTRRWTHSILPLSAEGMMDLSRVCTIVARRHSVHVVRLGDEPPSSPCVTSVAAHTFPSAGRSRSAASKSKIVWHSMCGPSGMKQEGAAVVCIQQHFFDLFKVSTSKAGTQHLWQRRGSTHHTYWGSGGLQHHRHPTLDYSPK